MFTGLIEAIGEVTEIKAASNGLRLRVRTGLSAGLKVGDSLAVEGVCLTISLIEGEEAHFYVGHETINVTVEKFDNNFVVTASVSILSVPCVLILA